MSPEKRNDNKYNLIPIYKVLIAYFINYVS